MSGRACSMHAKYENTHKVFSENINVYNIWQT